MAKGIKAGDEVAITAIVRKRVTEDRVSVSIPHRGVSALDSGQGIDAERDS